MVIEVPVAARDEAKDHQPVRAVLLTALLLAFCLSLTLPLLLDMRLSPTYYAFPIMATAPLALLIPYLRWRRMERIQAGVELPLLGLLCSLSVLALTYAAMRLNLPLTDANLAAADAALGYHAPSLVSWIDSRRELAWIFGMSYGAFFPQLLLLPAVLCASGQLRRAYSMVLAYLFLGTSGAAISALFPSEGVYIYYGVAPDVLRSINHEAGTLFLRSFNAVRSDPYFILELREAAGIVTFPSGHAGAAILCGWAAWGSRPLRWPLLLINACMYASALTHGAHYLVDILAGTALALACIALVTRVADGKLSVFSAPWRRLGARAA
jgi:membrane-associated phospholipid phosphatase